MVAPDPDLSIPRSLEQNWQLLISADKSNPKKNIPAKTLILPSVDNVVEYINSSDVQSSKENPVDVLVTGSLYLVGGALTVLGFSTC